MPGIGGQSHRPVYRAAYFLGVTMRRAVELVRSSCHSIVKKATRSKARRRHRPAGSRRSAIFSRLHRMEERLQEFEYNLSEASTSRGRTELPDIPGSERPSAAISPDLIEALTDPDPGVRRLAIGGIVDSGGEQTNFLLVEALNDPEASVRCAAAAAAAQVGATSAVFSLLLSLDDSALEVRQEVKHAVEKITGTRIDFDPEQKQVQRRKKIEKLKNWWKEERFSELAEEVKGTKDK